MISKTKYSYTVSRAILQVTAILFFTQLFLESSGVITRDKGFEWAVPACGGALLIAVMYATLLILLNARARGRK